MSEKDVVAMERGSRLAADRRARGWTQRQLSEKTGWTQRDEDEGRAHGISPSRIGNYEQGSRRIEVEEAEIFGEIFEMPAAYFMCLISEREARVLQALRGPPPPAPPPIRPSAKAVPGASSS